MPRIRVGQLNIRNMLISLFTIIVRCLLAYFIVSKLHLCELALMASREPRGEFTGCIVQQRFLGLFFFVHCRKNIWLNFAAKVLSFYNVGNVRITEHLRLFQYRFY